MIDWVHEELIAWGQWANRIADGQGNYPGEAPYLTMKSDGDHASREFPFERVPEDFAVVDGAVKALIEPLAVVVRVYYKGAPHVKPVSWHRTCAALCISREMFNDRLDAAHRFIAPRISKQTVAEDRSR